MGDSELGILEFMLAFVARAGKLAQKIAMPFLPAGASGDIFFDGMALSGRSVP
jgi:hypothetical protein